VSRDILDDRLLGALHIRAMTRAGLHHDPAVEHVAFQAGTLDALMAGCYDGDATIGDLLDHGDLGIGTTQGLGGELVVVDGEAFVVDGDGVVLPVPPGTRTPFAVVCRFAPAAPVRATDLDQEELRARIQEVAPVGAADRAAIRSVEGD
jgi:acetolactate decarboxylase